MQPGEERLALRRDLLVEPVVGHQMDVLDAVLGGHGDDGAALAQVDACARPKLLRVDREGEAQVALDVAIVLFEEVEARGELRVERGELIEGGVLAEQLGGEEGGEGQLHHDPLVQRLAERAPDEIKEAKVLRVGRARGWVWVQVALARLAKVASLGVEGLGEDVLHELLEDAMSVNTRLDHTERVDELDTDGALERVGWQRAQLHVTVLEQLVTAHLDAASAQVLGKCLVRQLIFLALDEVAEEIHAPLEGDDPRHALEQSPRAWLALLKLTVQLRVTNLGHEPRARRTKGSARVAVGEQRKQPQRRVSNRLPPLARVGRGDDGADA